MPIIFLCISSISFLSHYISYIRCRFLKKNYDTCLKNASAVYFHLCISWRSETGLCCRLALIRVIIALSSCFDCMHNVLVCLSVYYQKYLPQGQDIFQSYLCCLNTHIHDCLLFFSIHLSLSVFTPLRTWVRVWIMWMADAKYDFWVWMLCSVLSSIFSMFAVTAMYLLYLKHCYKFENTNSLACINLFRLQIKSVPLSQQWRQSNVIQIWSWHCGYSVQNNINSEINKKLKKDHYIFCN